jgi:hypothetical protein
VDVIHTLNRSIKNGLNGKFYVRYLRTRATSLLEQKREVKALSVFHGFAFPFVLKRTASIFRDFTQRPVGVGSTPRCPPVSQKP